MSRRSLRLILTIYVISTIVFLAGTGCAGPIINRNGKKAVSETTFKRDLSAFQDSISTKLENEVAKIRDEIQNRQEQQDELEDLRKRISKLESRDSLIDSVLIDHIQAIRNQVEEMKNRIDNMLRHRN